MVWIRDDNTAFFDEDIELAFYFRRGDSPGEGGSGQAWDSDLLERLSSKIPEGDSCCYLSYGQPGGFAPHRASKPLEVSLPFIEKSRRYYLGRLYPSGTSMIR